MASLLRLGFLCVFLIGVLYVVFFTGRRGRKFPPGLTAVLWLLHWSS